MQNLSCGLRHILVYVTLESVFPPATDSSSDIALLRAANRAMQRKASQGTEDAFLFVVVGPHTLEAINLAISAYGFPNATAVCLEAEDVEQPLRMREERILTDVANAIEIWLNREHSGAVQAFAEDYSETELWWSGVECSDNVFGWPFDDSDFAEALPITHRGKATTWLTILGHAVELEEIQTTMPELLGDENAAAWAVTLCEWLHGFEAACGNGYNRFSSEYSSLLMPSEFFLGFELARLSGDDLATLCDAHDEDTKGLSVVAMRAVTKDRRGELRAHSLHFLAGIARYFGHCIRQFGQPSMSQAEMR
jgi:hypothetical protein